jgi:enoyl-[acyl-carrier protein] reductase I
MGLLDGKKALIFGVANDHSIAWGIAKALHEHGAAEVGFSSVEMLLEKRVRPLAASIGSGFVEPCDVRSDADVTRVFDAWAARHPGGDGTGADSLDILVHALAFANRRSRRRSVDTSRRAARHDVRGACLPSARPPRTRTRRRPACSRTKFEKVVRH